MVRWYSGNCRTIIAFREKYHLFCKKIILTRVDKNGPYLCTITKRNCVMSKETLLWINASVEIANLIDDLELEFVAEYSED